MLKSVVLPGAAVTLAAAALLLPLRGQEAVAQDGAALRQRGRPRNQPGLDAEVPCGAQGRRRGTIKEAGTQEFVSSVGQKDKNHVFIFEVFNNSAAWDAIRRPRLTRSSSASP